ncbi:hypothetical protein C8J57DRAFT_207593 [Mycena rebaudengoi]|nr:hypothetical protein C8J57DRAFT_207593 [Mycena rebaudengoi]
MNWTDREETSSCLPPTPSADRLYSSIAGNSPWPSLQSQTTKDVFQSVLQGRKVGKHCAMEGPFGHSISKLLRKASRTIYDSRETRILGRFPKRNRFISDYIFEKAGKRRCEASWQSSAATPRVLRWPEMCVIAYFGRL